LTPNRRIKSDQTKFGPLQKKVSRKLKLGRELDAIQIRPKIGTTKITQICILIKLERNYP
jgi:hypothetical protein